MKFTEAQLEQAFIDLLHEEEVPHVVGGEILRAPEEVLIIEDLKAFLQKKYQSEGITTSEIESIILHLESYPASDCCMLQDKFTISCPKFGTN